MLIITNKTISETVDLDNKDNWTTRKNINAKNFGNIEFHHFKGSKLITTLSIVKNEVFNCKDQDEIEDFEIEDFQLTCKYRLEDHRKPLSYKGNQNFYHNLQGAIKGAVNFQS